MQSIGQPGSLTTPTAAPGPVGAASYRSFEELTPWPQSDPVPPPSKPVSLVPAKQAMGAEGSKSYV
jgi:hypothetical protein